MLKMRKRRNISTSVSESQSSSKISLRHTRGIPVTQLGPQTRKKKLNIKEMLGVKRRAVYEVDEVDSFPRVMLERLVCKSLHENITSNTSDCSEKDLILSKECTEKNSKLRNRSTIDNDLIRSVQSPSKDLLLSGCSLIQTNVKTEDGDINTRKSGRHRFAPIKLADADIKANKRASPIIESCSSKRKGPAAAAVVQKLLTSLLVKKNLFDKSVESLSSKQKESCGDNKDLKMCVFENEDLNVGSTMCATVVPPSKDKDNIMSVDNKPDISTMGFCHSVKSAYDKMFSDEVNKQIMACEEFYQCLGLIRSELADEICRKVSDENENFYRCGGRSTVLLQARHQLRQLQRAHRIREATRRINYNDTLVLYGNRYVTRQEADGLLNEARGRRDVKGLKKGSIGDGLLTCVAGTASSKASSRSDTELLTAVAGDLETVSDRIKTLDADDLNEVEESVTDSDASLKVVSHKVRRRDGSKASKGAVLYVEKDGGRFSSAGSSVTQEIARHSKRSRRHAGVDWRFCYGSIGAGSSPGSDLLTSALNKAPSFTANSKKEMLLHRVSILASDKKNKLTQKGESNLKRGGGIKNTPIAGAGKIRRKEVKEESDYEIKDFVQQDFPRGENLIKDLVRNTETKCADDSVEDVSYRMRDRRRGRLRNFVRSVIKDFDCFLHDIEDGGVCVKDLSYRELLELKNTITSDGRYRIRSMKQKQVSEADFFFDVTIVEGRYHWLMSPNNEKVALAGTVANASMGAAAQCSSSSSRHGIQDDRTIKSHESEDSRSTDDANKDATSDTHAVGPIRAKEPFVSLSQQRQWRDLEFRMSRQAQRKEMAAAEAARVPSLDRIIRDAQQRRKAQCSTNTDITGTLPASPSKTTTKCWSASPKKPSSANTSASPAKSLTASQLLQMRIRDNMAPVKFGGSGSGVQAANNFLSALAGDVNNSSRSPAPVGIFAPKNMSSCSVKSDSTLEGEALRDKESLPEIIIDERGESDEDFELRGDSASIVPENTTIAHLTSGVVAPKNTASVLCTEKHSEAESLGENNLANRAVSLGAAMAETGGLQLSASSGLKKRSTIMCGNDLLIMSGHSDAKCKEEVAAMVHQFMKQDRCSELELHSETDVLCGDNSSSAAALTTSTTSAAAPVLNQLLASGHHPRLVVRSGAGGVMRPLALRFKAKPSATITAVPQPHPRLLIDSSLSLSLPRRGRPPSQVSRPPKLPVGRPPLYLTVAPRYTKPVRLPPAAQPSGIIRYVAVPRAASGVGGGGIILKATSGERRSQTVLFSSPSTSAIDSQNSTSINANHSHKRVASFDVLGAQQHSSESPAYSNRFP